LCQVSQAREKISAEALLDWLRNEDDQTWGALVENIDESTDDNIVFETWHGGNSSSVTRCRGVVGNNKFYR